MATCVLLIRVKVIPCRIFISSRSHHHLHLFFLSFSFFLHSSILRPFETQQRFSFRQGKEIKNSYSSHTYICTYTKRKKMAEYVLLANNKVLFTNRGRINYGNKVIRLLFKIDRTDQSVYPDEV